MKTDHKAAVLVLFCLGFITAPQVRATEPKTPEPVGDAQRATEAPVRQGVNKPVNPSPCVAKCRAKPGECLEVSDPESDEADPLSGLRALFNALGDGNTTEISSSDLKKYFSLSDDPCERGSTFVAFVPSDGDNTSRRRLRNLGLSCRVAASVKLPSDSLLEAGFLVPDELELDYTASDKTLNFVPTLGSVAPALFFSSKSFQNDFGGTVMSVTFGSSESFVETQSGCIWLRHPEKSR